MPQRAVFDMRALYMPSAKACYGISSTLALSDIWQYRRLTQVYSGNVSIGVVH